MSIRATDAVHERRGFASMEYMLVAAFLAIMVVGALTDFDSMLRLSVASLLQDTQSMRVALN